MIEWEPYWASCEYIMQQAQTYDCSIMDYEDAARELDPHEAAQRYTELEVVKDNLEQMLELVYIDMQVLNKQHHIVDEVPEPTRQQQWKLNEHGQWEPIKHGNHT